MDQDHAAQNGVDGGVQGPGGERRDGERNEAGGYEALECPVIGPVRGGGIGYWDRIIDYIFCQSWSARGLCGP